MYYQAAAEGYNLTSLAYANKAAADMLARNSENVNAAMEFENWLFLDVLLRVSCLAPPELIAAAQAYYQTVPFTAGRWTTSNLNLLAAATRYLSSVMFPNGTFVPFSAADPTGKKTVFERAAKLYYGLVAEYASQDYGVYNLFTFVTVRDFSDDPALVTLADTGLQVSMARHAATWWSDRLVTQCMRCESNDYHNYNIWWFLADLWIYFGDDEIDILHQPKRGWLLTYSATVNYNINATILNIAKQTGDRTVRASGLGEYSYYLTSYITDSYGIYIGNTPVVSHEAIPGQSTLPGIFWNGHNATTTSSRSNFYMGVPGNDYLNGEYEWDGYVQEWLLYKNTHLLVVDNVLQRMNATSMGGAPFIIGSMPSTKQYPISYMDASCAATLCDAKDPAYRLFYGFGPSSVLIAVSSSRPITVGAAAGKGSNDQSFRVRRPGVAVEAAKPAEVAGAGMQEKLAAFAARVKAGTRFAFAPPVNGTQRAELGYTDTAGNTLYKMFQYSGNSMANWFAYPPLERINGAAPPAFLNWPIFDSPLVWQSNYPAFNAGQYSYGYYPPCPVYWRNTTDGAWDEVPYPSQARKTKFPNLPAGVKCVPPPSHKNKVM
ncbi:hypothetical protein DFJ73DRAFT_868946 [Zopfochytrium polystomum]|nr:hypothetical protein DFJ73DRAFT_868946 [Zopfochytrium polystomum]